MINASSLTLEECLRLNFTVPPEAIQVLVDAQEKLLGLEALPAYIQEARAQFPEEDFLSEARAIVFDLVKNTRGANKDKAERLAAMLEDVEMTTHCATEYGLSELNKALDALDGG